MTHDWAPLPIRISDERMAEINTDPSAGWWTTRTSPPNIIPALDVYPHKFGTECPCQPVDDGEIVTHRAFDGRERYEEGRARPN